MSAYDAFAPIYDVWAADMTEDVDFYVELAREADGPVVELAVGTGRVAIPIAEDREAGDRDRLVTGDARSRSRARGRSGGRARSPRSDMRDLSPSSPPRIS